MKVEIQRPPPSEDLVTVTMTRREAIILKCLVGGIGWAQPTPGGDMCRDLFVEMEEIETGTASFSDYFKGEIDSR